MHRLHSVSFLNMQTSQILASLRSSLFSHCWYTQEVVLACTLLLCFPFVLLDLVVLAAVPVVVLLLLHLFFFSSSCVCYLCVFIWGHAWVLFGDPSFFYWLFYLFTFQMLFFFSFSPPQTFLPLPPWGCSPTCPPTLASATYCSPILGHQASTGPRGSPPSVAR